MSNCVIVERALPVAVASFIENGGSVLFDVVKDQAPPPKPGLVVEQRQQQGGGQYQHHHSSAPTTPPAKKRAQNCTHDKHGGCCLG